MTAIARVTAHQIAYPDPNDAGHERRTVLVSVETGDGMIGWGEGIAMWPEACRATVVVVADGLGPLLLGGDPRDVARLHRTMRAHTWWYGNGGIACFALSALDMALWDLKGRLEGRPLHDLLGGRLREDLPACASAHVNKDGVEACVEEAASFARRGFPSMKLGLGKKGLSGLGGDVERDIAFVHAVRAAIGPDVELIIDIGNGVSWNVATAIRAAHGMGEAMIGWLEEPLDPGNIAGYRELKAATDIPVGSGEREWTVGAYARLLETGTVDVVGVDPARAEGISGFRAVDALVAERGATINAHAWSTAVTTAASLHLSVAARSARLFELKPFDVVVQTDLVDRPIRMEAGRVRPPEGPGLGINVNADVVRCLSTASAETS